MVNILLSANNFHEPWIFHRLKDLIKPEYTVAVVPFSFHEDWIDGEKAFQDCYNPKYGKYYEEIVAPFKTYGISCDNIKFIDYFKDNAKTAKALVEGSDIVFFTGGLPDKAMERIHKFHLEETLKSFKGIVIGNSAGAMIQLEEYHITPDKDYNTFGYYKGLGLLNSAYIEVHFEDTGLQNHSIRKVLCEKRKPLYAITNNGGIISIDGKIESFGEVDIFNITKGI